MTETKTKATAPDPQAIPATDQIVDAWLATFANTVMAEQTACYNFLMRRADDLKSKLRG